MLQARGLSVEVGGRLTLVEASFSVRAGEKVGLVGRNGAGKTSMLKVLGGERPAAGGMVHVKGALGYLPQEPRPQGSGVDATALSHVLSGRGLDDEARRIEKLRIRLEEEPSERNVGRYSRAEEAYALAGGYAAESEVRRILAGLGLNADRADQPIAVLSGGERRRVELARILFAGSDVLILDEPTNHLDVDAKTWLLQYLRSYRGALLVVSHDIELLDEAITRVLHLDEGELIEYKGTYTQYLDARRKDEARLAKLAERQQAEIHRLAQLADSMRGQTEKRARTAKVLDRRVERLRDSAVSGPSHQRTLSLRFPPPPHAGRTVLEAEGLAKSYGGPPIFEGVDFAVERGERLLVLGLNGAGKTTLLRILAGLHSADRGEVHFGTGVRAGYYAQEHEGITPGRAVIEHMRSAATVPDQDLRSILGMFGLSGDMAFQDAGTLSGGEKTKLALGQLVCGAHNLLLLDEPTNNLDPPSRDAVAESLAAWPGTMVIVSHDTDFVESLQPHKVLLLPDGTLDYWDESLLDLVSLA
ncbi:MAG: ABC-F family ATP-binding cassette domain-containing protein [Acidimicrobiia bacterium]